MESSYEFERHYQGGGSAAACIHPEHVTVNDYASPATLSDVVMKRTELL